MFVILLPLSYVDKNGNPCAIYHDQNRLKINFWYHPRSTTSWVMWFFLFDLRNIMFIGFLSNNRYNCMLMIDQCRCFDNNSTKWKDDLFQPNRIESSCCHQLSQKLLSLVLKNNYVCILFLGATWMYRTFWSQNVCAH